MLGGGVCEMVKLLSVCIQLVLLPSLVVCLVETQTHNCAAQETSQKHK